MTRPLDRGNKHPLMPGAGPRDPFGDNATLLRNEALKFLVGFVINKIFLIVAEAASTLFSDLSG